MKRVFNVDHEATLARLRELTASLQEANDIAKELYAERRALIAEATSNRVPHGDIARACNCNPHAVAMIARGPRGKSEPGRRRAQHAA